MTLITVGSIENSHFPKEILGQKWDTIKTKQRKMEHNG